MKKTIIFIAGLTILSCLTILNSCKKDDDSAYGNAKIHLSTFTNVGWTKVGLQYDCILNDASITQAIVDNGLVEVYVKDGTGSWTALPYVWPINSQPYSVMYMFTYSLGAVKISALNTNFSQTANPGTSTFKVICTEAL